MRAIGLMSGTSMDGIDVALIETDGENAVQRGPALTYPYSTAMRSSLRKGLTDGMTILTRGERPGRLALLEQYLTDLHVEVVGHFLDDAQINADSVDVIGFHGHTVLHRPEDGLSVQIGDGARLASEAGIDVVFDLRASDVGAGGMGAPLAPIYHRGLAGGLSLPVAFVNVGGVANVTFVGKGVGNGLNGTEAGNASEPVSDLIAFDTGPGNALIDDWMNTSTGEAYDKDGACAARGTIDKRVLGELLGNPYFSQPPPKALDRNAFDFELLAGMNVEDGAATLTAFTASTIGKAAKFMPEKPTQWIICGGGRRNATLMSLIAQSVGGNVVAAEDVGLGGDSIEAEAWAYLAVRSLKGLPITFPGTTGVPQPLTGGVLARA